MNHFPTRTVAPMQTLDSHVFWEACEAERLVLPTCDACAHVFYYPRLACPRCGARKLSWTEASGLGSIYSYTCVHTSFYGSVWESELPYVVLLIDLEEGPRMLSRLIGDDQALRVGAAVAVAFPVIDGRRYPYFRLTEGPLREH